MSREVHRPVGERTLRAVKFFNKVDEAVSNATFPLVRWLMKQTGVEMYKVSSLGEQRAMIKRIAPIIKNAIEINVVEGDLSEGLFSSGREFPPDSRIRVTQTPQGTAPEDVRRAWLGIEMDAYKLSASDGELDLTSGEQSSTQRQTEDIYAVKLEDALQSLEQNSPEAAEWFKNNLAPKIDALSFGADEVAVLRH